MIHDPSTVSARGQAGTRRRTDHEQAYSIIPFLFVHGRGPLSLLAGMPPGNVVGLIELEGEAAQVFGGGQDGAEGSAGSGMERVARLSASEHDAVMGTLGWRCRARLAAGSWFLTNWQVSSHSSLRLEGYKSAFRCLPQLKVAAAARSQVSVFCCFRVVVPPLRMSCWCRHHQCRAMFASLTVCSALKSEYI